MEKGNCTEGTLDDILPQQLTIMDIIVTAVLERILPIFLAVALLTWLWWILKQHISCSILLGVFIAAVAVQNTEQRLPGVVAGVSGILLGILGSALFNQIRVDEPETISARRNSGPLPPLETVSLGGPPRQGSHPHEFGLSQLQLYNGLTRYSQYKQDLLQRELREFFALRELFLSHSEEVNEGLNNPGESSGRAASGSVMLSGSAQEIQNPPSTSVSQSQLMQLLGGMSDMRGPGLLAQLNQLAPGLANLGGGGGGSMDGGSTDGAAATATETASSGGGSGTGTGHKPQSLLKLKKPNTPAPKTPAANAPGPIQLEDRQSILTRMQTTAPEVQVDLASALKSDAIRHITDCPTVKKSVPPLAQLGAETAEGTGHDLDEFIPLLPQHGGADTSEGTTQDVGVETLKSPQFQSAYCAAFPTGQLGPPIAQFGFSADAVTAAQNENLEGFVKPIQGETISEAPSNSDVVSDSQDSVTEVK